MFKNILKILGLIIIYFSIINLSYGECNFDNATFTSALNDCFPNDSSLVTFSGKTLEINSGFKTVIISWTSTIATLLSILAVGSIVYGGLLMTLSAGEEEKVKKGKDVIKWGMLGFLAIISSGAIIALVVNFIYGISTV